MCLAPLKKFSINVQDYGAPIGYRISSKHQDGEGTWFKGNSS